MHPDPRYIRDGMIYFDADPFMLPRTDLLLLQLGRGRTIRGSSSVAIGLALLIVQDVDQLENGRKYSRVGMFDVADCSFWTKNRVQRTVTII